MKVSLSLDNYFSRICFFPGKHGDVFQLPVSICPGVKRFPVTNPMAVHGLIPYISSTVDLSCLCTASGSSQCMWQTLLWCQEQC